jgi:hypothetical protein
VAKNNPSVTSHALSFIGNGHHVMSAIDQLHEDQSLMWLTEFGCGKEQGEPLIRLRGFDQHHQDVPLAPLYFFPGRGCSGRLVPRAWWWVTERTLAVLDKLNQLQAAAADGYESDHSFLYTVADVSQ